MSRLAFSTHIICDILYVLIINFITLFYRYTKRRIRSPNGGLHWEDKISSFLKVICGVVMWPFEHFGSLWFIQKLGKSLFFPTSSCLPLTDKLVMQTPSSFDACNWNSSSLIAPKQCSKLRNPYDVDAMVRPFWFK